ncbi:Galactokinase [subsurface metagenome]
MRDSGTLGARLTGAGFGGCAVALVHDKDCRKVIDSVQKLYYGKYIIENRPELIEQAKGNTVIFPVKPSEGAMVKHLVKK